MKWSKLLNNFRSELIRNLSVSKFLFFHQFFFLGTGNGLVLNRVVIESVQKFTNSGTEVVRNGPKLYSYNRFSIGEIMLKMWIKKYLWSPNLTLCVITSFFISLQWVRIPYLHILLSRGAETSYDFSILCMGWVRLSIQKQQRSFLHIFTHFPSHN